MEEGALRIVALQRLIVTMGKPVVVEVAGAVRAGGIGIVAASDIAVVAEEATFALTEVKLGLAAAIISLTVHHRMNPAGGGADHPGRRGVRRRRRGGVRPGDDAPSPPQRPRRPRSSGCVRRSRPAPPQGLRESKRILNRDLLARIDAGGEEMAALSARLFASDDAREAMTAFLAKKQ